MKNNNLKVIELETSNTLNTALGITSDRENELIKALRHAEIDHESVSGVGVAISEKCNHANELWYIAVLFGMKIGHERASIEMMQTMRNNE